MESFKCEGNQMKRRAQASIGESEAVRKKIVISNNT
jgi:hypothetical protein